MINEEANCKYCEEFKSGDCDKSATDCICKKCVRNLGQCLTTRYCRETESTLS